MKKFGFLFLVFILVMCSSSNESEDIIETTTTLETETPVNDNDSTTTTSNQGDNTDIVESYEYDNEKMSPFTGLELAPEIWLKRPRRVIALSLIHI